MTLTTINPKVKSAIKGFEGILAKITFKIYSAPDGDWMLRITVLGISFDIDVTDLLAQIKSAKNK